MTKNVIEGDEIYQLVKRGEIDPHEVEVVGAHAVEVSILWKSSILHVAHLDGSHDFVLSTREVKKAPADRALLSGLAAGTALISAGAAMQSYAVGAVGTLVALAGAGAGIALDARNDTTRRDSSRFVVGAELLPGEGDAPVVLNREGGATTFVFLPGATGDVEIDGAKRSLADLVASGACRPSATLPGAHEIEVRPGARYRMEAGGLTVLARVVAPGRRVAGATRRDPARTWAGVGATGAVAALVGAALFASNEDGMMTGGNDEDRIAELRAYITRQTAREQLPEPTHADEANAEAGGTGTRSAGAEGAAGSRTAPARNTRLAVRRNNLPEQLANRSAHEQIRDRGIFAALPGPNGAQSGTTGIVSPFGGLTESGRDDESANGSLHGEAIGDSFGYGGLGNMGTGWGGGGDGIGTVGQGRLGTIGRGAGTGDGDSYGDSAGRRLRNRDPRPPSITPTPPTVAGGLSPEAIRRVVLRNLGQVSHCHEQGLAQNPTLAGRVVIRFIIGGDGAVMGSTVATGTSVSVPSVSQCIATAARRWQFPQPVGGGTVSVNYPFSLNPAQ